MERLRLTFFFRVGQTVCWLQPDGPRYTIGARLYAEGNWSPTFTALPQPHGPEEPQHVYWLYDPQNILRAFWAKERDLYVAWGESP
jgi:hypothetical protein